MSLDMPKYDIALSFLARDEELAAGFNERLSDGFEVFFFPRRQEELAGTDGQETMRVPFREDSRLVVVLYREPWGKTPWTAVEDTAIKDRGLANGWDHLIFVALTRDSSLPKWLPDQRVRFNYQDFGFEEAIGAIKKRALENGAKYSPMTAAKRAQLFRLEEKYRFERTSLEPEAVDQSAKRLFTRVEEICAEISAAGNISMRYGAVENAVTITDGTVGIVARWQRPHRSSLDKSCLIIEKYSGPIYTPADFPQVYIHRPELLEKSEYSPDLSRAREYGWKPSRRDEFFTSHDLAEKVVIQFIELVEKSRSGELRNSNWR